MKNNKHNYTSIEAFMDDDGRVVISPQVMKLLKPKLTADGKNYKANTIRDRHLLGFRAIAHKGGQRSFVYRYRPKGRDENGKIYDHINIHLGRWFDNTDPKEKDLLGITPAVAKKMAQDMQMKIRSGEDPNLVLEARKKGKTLRQVFTDWIEKRVRSPRYIKSIDDYRSRYNIYILQNSKKQHHKQLYRSFRDAFRIVSEPIKKLTKDDYISLHAAISEHKKTTANRLMEDIRLVEKYAAETKAMVRAPVEFAKKDLNPEIARMEKEDPFTPEDMFKFRRAALSLVREDRERYLVPVMQLLLAAVLGLRSKSEVYCILWDAVNINARHINIIDTKNEKPFKKLYDYRAAAIFRVMANHRHTIFHKDKRFRYVFPTPNKKSKTKFLRDPRKTYRTILSRAGLKYKCPHFLRHTWATNTFAASSDIKTTAAANNWQDLKSVEIYTKVNDRMQRELLKKTSTYLNKNRSHAS